VFFSEKKLFLLVGKGFFFIFAALEFTPFLERPVIEKPL
jgi:hypothetical protein